MYDEPMRDVRNVDGRKRYVPRSQPIVGSGSRDIWRRSPSFSSLHAGLMPRLKCWTRARENGRSSVSSDGINRRWIPGGWCMIHREPHRATPRRKMVCTLHTIMRQQRAALARACTRDRQCVGTHARCSTIQGVKQVVVTGGRGRALLLEL